MTDRSKNTGDADAGSRDPRDRDLDELLEQAAAAERAETRHLTRDSAAFLERLRPRLPRDPGAAPGRFPLARGWSVAAAIPLLVALVVIFARKDAPNPAPLSHTDLAVVEDLDVLEVLDGFAPEELEELDSDSLLELLENLDLLESLDTSILEDGDETG